MVGPVYLTHRCLGTKDWAFGWFEGSKQMFEREAFKSNPRGLIGTNEDVFQLIMVGNSCWKRKF